MSNARTGNITGLTRGGQVFHHYLKMLWEVASKLIGFVVFISFLIFVFSLYYKSNKVEFLAAINYIQSWWVCILSDAPDANVFYFTDWFDTQMISSKGVYFHQVIRSQAFSFLGDMAAAFTFSFMFFIGFFVVAIAFLRKKGEGLNEETFVRGSQLIDAPDAKKYMAKLANDLPMGDLNIGGVPIPLDWEVQSFLVFGAPGTGKSVITANWIESARKGDKKAIIFDRSGGFVEKFYDPSKDIIINPYDTRSAKWDVFKECVADYDFTYIANNLITKNDKDSPFWPLAARLVFKSLLMKESVQPNPSLNGLMDTVLKCSLNQMVDACKGTDAASVFDKEGLKMANTIRSVIAAEVEILRVMDSRNSDFCMRDWVNNDKGGFIFISTLKAQEEALRPFLTLMIDLFMINVLSLSPDLKRRVWAYIDEAQALGKLQTLPTYLAEARKYGGAAMVGFQGYSQAKRIYSDEGVEELSDLFSTFIVLRCNGNKTSEWCAKQLGETDNIEVNESLSYGLHSARDGANLQNSRRERKIVLGSELQNLPDLTGYVKFGREVPVIKFEEKYVSRKDISKPFILDENLIRKQLDAIATSTEEEDNSYFGGFDSSQEESSSILNNATELHQQATEQSMGVFENVEYTEIADISESPDYELTDTFSDFDGSR